MEGRRGDEGRVSGREMRCDGGRIQGLREGEVVKEEEGEGKESVSEGQKGKEGSQMVLGRAVKGC